MTTARIWNYFPNPAGIPGTTMQRLHFAGDPVAEGIRLAAITRELPPGQRGLHINDLGGGVSADEFHWYTRKDGKPLTKEQAEEVYVQGCRGMSVHDSLAWCSLFAASYGNHGGAPWDFVMSNVETWPGAFLPIDATWDDVVRWRNLDPLAEKQEQIDAVQQWAAVIASNHTGRCLRAIAPYDCVKVNCQSIAFTSETKKLHGHKIESATPCDVSCPQIYLTDVHGACKDKTPSAILASACALWDAIPSPKVCCVAPPDWGGTGDKASVPGCRSKMFTANKGTPNEWSQKWWLKNLSVWADEYRAFIEYVAEGRTDVVIWHCEGKHYGLAPSAASIKLMREAFAGVGA